jgi:hypothetical protein
MNTPATTTSPAPAPVRPLVQVTDHNGDLLATVSPVEEYAQVLLADGTLFRLDEATCRTLASALLDVFAKPEVDSAHSEPDVSGGRTA